MSKNVGTVDRVIRIALAVVALYLAFGAHGIAEAVLFIVAAVLLGTALMGRCALYSVFGIRTCPRSEGPKR